MSAKPNARPHLHPVLAQLRDEMEREDGYVEGEANWVEFLSTDAYIDADVKGGESRVRIRAYFTSDDGATPTEGEVLAWVKKQPRPASGVVQALLEELDDGTVESSPRLVFERPVAAFTTEHIEGDIIRFARAWNVRGVAAPQPEAQFDRGDPAELPPQNAWLLMGDEASYWSPEGLEEVRAEGVGIYDELWTAPKNGELGDLVLVYFTEPTKAACFVARLASRSFWRSDLTANAQKAVDNHQWWAYITPPVEIEPISFKDLREATGGHLVLKGRSGHYLPPQVIEGLSIIARNPEQQTEAERIVRTPTGDPRLPDPRTVSFDVWRTIPSGALALEAKVSEYVVGPLARFISAHQEAPAPMPTVRNEYKVPSGYVDFVMCADEVPLVAIEVKRAIRRPPTGVWRDSPDFLQLKRYMDDLDVPGLLIDAHGILLVRQGNETPEMEIVRAEATPCDIDALHDRLFADAPH